MPLRRLDLRLSIHGLLQHRLVLILVSLSPPK
jgi:hypothetical protein